MRFLLLLCALLISTTLVAQESSTMVTIPGNTIALVNLRGGPGTSFNVVSILQSQTQVVFTGRNASSTWLLADANGTVGWLSYTFVNVEGNVQSLSVVNSISSRSNTSTNTTTEVEAPPQVSTLPDSAPTNIIPDVSGTARQIFLRGLELGNRPDVFSKVGDSITASDQFLDTIGNGGLILHEYEYLRPVFEYFSQTPAGDHFSFANTSIAARSGWTAGDVLDPERAPRDLCSQGESPLVCEYRLTRPTVALIMFGTNDVGWVDSRVYQDNLHIIVQTSIDMGVIPVLSTIPDQYGTPGSRRVGEFNDIIRGIAASYDVPLWDYWLAMQGLPNGGLGSDGVHPSYDARTAETGLMSPDGLRYGYNMRNLTALMVLDAVWRYAMD